MDLPAELRQSIEALEKTIQNHADASRPFSNRVDPTDKLSHIEDKLSLLEEKIAAYTCLHAQQNSRVSNLKKCTSGHWRYSENVARTVEASRGPQSVSGTTGKTTWTRAFAPNDPTSNHFEEIFKEMDMRLGEAEGMAEALRKQIEPFTSSNSSQSSASSPNENVKYLLKTEQELSGALQRRFGQIHDEIDLMRKNYRNFCSKYRKDSRDPFAPKIVETTEREKDRESQVKNFFGVSNTASNSGLNTTNTPSFNLSGGTANSASSSLPTATTGLFPISGNPTASTAVKPASSSLGLFSFGRN